jgi:predicted RNA-binding Zn-ribbon protein involved in translation (DUF1610 family)
MNNMIQRQIDARNNELVAECGNCKKTLTREQAQLTQCPHCGVYWTHEVDQFGNKHEIPGGAARAEALAQQDPKFAWKPPRRVFYRGIVLIVFGTIGVITFTARLLIYLSR